MRTLLLFTAIVVAVFLFTPVSVDSALSFLKEKLGIDSVYVLIGIAAGVAILMIMMAMWRLLVILTLLLSLVVGLMFAIDFSGTKGVELIKGRLSGLTLGAEEIGDMPASRVALRIAVDVSDQKLVLMRGDAELKTYPISTAVKGTGSQKGSQRTPLGRHRISEKVGDGAPIGTIFKGFKNTGKLAEIHTNPMDVKEDHVTTRVMWLDGMEYGVNKGGNVDSHSRYIYIHGTPEEGLIGQPASHGCIRMLNSDVVELYNKVNVNTKVMIHE